MNWFNRAEHLVEVKPETVQPFARSNLWHGIFMNRASELGERLLLGLFWVANWVKLTKLKSEIASLEKQKAEDQALPLAREDTVNGIRELHREAVEAFERRLSAVISDPRFPGFKSSLTRFGEEIPSKERLEAAINLIPERRGAISRKEKDKSLQKWEARIEELKAQCVPLDGPEYHENTENGQDCRALFVQHWRRIQGELSKPANFDGILLKRCPESHQKAWDLLELKRYINPAGKLPFDPEN